jgi:hypothetical protein
MKKNRYFLVFYRDIKDGVWGYGQCLIITDGCYLNSKFVISDIETENGSSKAVLTNIIELSKADYDTFCE